VRAVHVVVGTSAARDGSAERRAAVDGLAAEVGVRLVDPGVDDADLHSTGCGEPAQSGGVPALGGVDVRVSAPAGLACVVEAVELREERVVRHRPGAQDEVGLGVGHEQAAVEPASDHGRVAVHPDDLRADTGHGADLPLDPCLVEQRRALRARYARGELDDCRVGVVPRRVRGAGETGREREQASDAKYAPAHP
jgi:hypothetical protein